MFSAQIVIIGPKINSTVSNRTTDTIFIYILLIKIYKQDNRQQDLVDLDPVTDTVQYY